MFYEFPADLTLDEVRDVVRRHNEALGVAAFIEADRGDFVIFNYVVSFDGSFPDLTGDPVRDREIGIIRECRGLTFDKETGLVALRKFHKFHNLFERADTQPDQINWNEAHILLSKMDGSMVSPLVMKDGSIEWVSKMGITHISPLVRAFVDKNPNFDEAAIWAKENNKTLLFEYCSRHNKIVVDYPEENLILLAVRDNSTGEYLPY